MENTYTLCTEFCDILTPTIKNLTKKLENAKKEFTKYTSISLDSNMNIDKASQMISDDKKLSESDVSAFTARIFDMQSIASELKLLLLIMKKVNCGECYKSNKICNICKFVKQLGTYDKKFINVLDKFCKQC